MRSQGLDQPLPEDVAFRPGDAGGDLSILPTRRRRPVGFHDTARTLVGGARTIGTWVKRDDRHGIEHIGDEELEDGARKSASADLRRQDAPPARRPLRTDDDEDAISDTSSDRGDGIDGSDSDDPERPRRRRGRRGGRGRRRPTAGEASDGGSDQPNDEAHDTGDPDADDGITVVLVEDRTSLVARLDDDRDEDDTDDLDDSIDDTADDVVDDEDVEDDDRDVGDDADDIEEDDDDSPQRSAPRNARRREPLAPVTDDQIPQAFVELGIQRPTLEQLARYGFATPTPIQVEAVPALLRGQDVVGIAQTGSGKTVAFGVPMVEKLDPNLPEIQGLVLVPTRELAQQVLDVLSDLARPWGLEAVGLLGGRSLKADFRALDDRPHIVVGTPGRILDHLRRQTLSLRHIRYAVLDEADQMLDIGFLPDIRRILSRTPQRRQTALFSATMPGSIKRLIWQFMTDPETVRVDAESTPVETIEQIYFEVAQRDKVRAMRELIERELKGRTLIFCNMKRSVDHLAHELERDGVRVRPLHGDLDQRQRDRVVQEFRSGEIDALIATNVAARGLDIPEITHVVNYDVPQNLEEYVHRIGRTGRAGRDGKAITFVCEWDLAAFDEISRGIGVEIARQELDLYGSR